MDGELPAIDDKFWNRLRYRGIRFKGHVLRDLPAIPGNQLARDLAWQSFKQACAAQGNILPRLIYLSEPQDPGFGMFRRRGPRTRKGSYPFDDLPFPQCMEADRIFRRLCGKWEGNLPSWRRAILIGRARRLALHPLDSAWGKRMRRIKGGVHCQRKYREQGRHPLENVHRAMTKRHKRAIPPVKGPVDKPDGAARERIGIAPAPVQQESMLAHVWNVAEVGVERVIQALRFSPEDDAVRFIRKYDSIPAKNRKRHSIEQICAAAGIPAEGMLTLSVTSYMEFSLMTSKLRLYANMDRVLRQAIKKAETKRGHADRRLVLEIAGILAPRA